MWARVANGYCRCSGGLKQASVNENEDYPGAIFSHQMIKNKIVQTYSRLGSNHLIKEIGQVENEDSKNSNAVDQSSHTGFLLQCATPGFHAAIS